MSAEINPRQYRKRSDAVSLVAVAIHITFVIVPLYISAVIGPSLFLIPLWLWFGLTMQGLLNLAHECAHYHVFKKRWGSDLLGRWVLAPLIVSDFDNYRRIHWSHHKELGSVKDPKYSFKIDIRGWRLLVFFVQCMIGVEAWRKFHYQNRERANTDLASSRFWIVRLLVAHCILAVSLFATAWRFGTHGVRTAALNTAIAYGVDIYGLVALTLFAATLRAIAEHQDGPDHPETVSQAVLRNLRCGPIERLIFGCYGFAEHATHHHYPAIPSYHLSNATAELAITTPSLRPRLSYKEILLAQARYPASHRRGVDR